MGTFPQGQGLHTAKQVLICWGQAQDVVMLLHLLWLKRVIQSPEICLHRETSWSFIPFKICPLLPRCHSSRSEVKGRREVMNYCCSGFTCSEVNWRASVIVPSFHLFLKLYFKNMNFLPLHTTRRLMINWDFKISLLDFLFILQVFFLWLWKKGDSNVHRREIEQRPWQLLPVSGFFSFLMVHTHPSQSLSLIFRAWPCFYIKHSPRPAVVWLDYWS